MVYEGVSQLINKSTCTEICPKLEIVSQGSPAPFGSLEWHGQQIGGALGVALPLLAIQGGVRYGFKSTGLAELIVGKGQTQGLAGEALLQSIKPGRQMALLAAEAGTTGFIFDFVARPVKEDEPFWSNRFANGTTGAVTWTTLSATASGLKSLSIHRNAVEQPWLINTFRQDLQRHAAAGAFAGVVDAQMHSLVRGKGFADTNDTLKSAYSFAMIGSAMHTMGEGLNRANGKQRIADIVNNDTELKAAAKVDPVARELLAQSGQLAVKKIENADLYKLLEFEFANKEFTETRLGRKVERKPWKPLSEVIKWDMEIALALTDAVIKLATDKYGPLKCKLIAKGKDSCVLLLETNEVLKISWGKHEAEHGNRSFDAPSSDLHSRTVDGYPLTSLKQPLVNTEVQPWLNQLFRTNAHRMGYNFTDWLGPQLGYGNKRLMLIDYFAVSSDMSNFHKFDSTVLQMSNLSRSFEAQR